MDKKYFITEFQEIIEKLNKIDLELDKNDWNKIQQYLSKTQKIHKKLLNHSSQFNQYLQSEDQDFIKIFQNLKTTILSKIDRLNEKIKEWMEEQKGKITQKRNVIQNISRYNPAPAKKTAYYIDKKK